MPRLNYRYVIRSVGIGEFVLDKRVTAICNYFSCKGNDEKQFHSEEMCLRDVLVDLHLETLLTTLPLANVGARGNYATSLISSRLFCGE